MPDDPVSSLLNIGPRSAEWLAAVGIDSVEDLRHVGPVEAYRRAKGAFPDQVSANLLVALEAGLRGIPWNRLPRNAREELKRRARQADPRRG